MWQPEVIIFEGEDEEAFKRDFVQTCVQYPSHPVADVAAYVFRNSPECSSRAAQAAIIWGNSLEIKERIRLARENGGKEGKPETDFEVELALAKAESRNMSNSASVRLGWFRIAQEMQGFIKDKSDANAGEKNARKFPVINVVQYDD